MKKPALTFSWQHAMDATLMLPSQPWSRLRENLKTGDIVLFSGDTFAARLVRCFTGSPWSHVGLVVRLPDMPGTPLLWEATRASKVSDISHGRAFDGVQLVSLDDRVVSYRGRIAVRRLQGVSADAEARARLDALMQAWHALPYRNFVRKHLSAWLRGSESLAWRKGGFCSELVAEVYRQWRLLPAERPAAHYVPRDFAPDDGVPLLRGSLSPACRIVM